MYAAEMTLQDQHSGLDSEAFHSFIRFHKPFAGCKFLQYIFRTNEGYCVHFNFACVVSIVDWFRNQTPSATSTRCRLPSADVHRKHSMPFGVYIRNKPLCRIASIALQPEPPHSFIRLTCQVVRPKQSLIEPCGTTQ